MITFEEYKERFSGILKDYKQNHALYNQQGEAFRISGSKEDWYARVQERSVITRDIFRQNEEILAELNVLMKEKLNLSIANDLYDFVMDLYLDGCDDYRLMMMIGQRLVDIYEKTQDLDRLLPMYRLMAFEKMIMFGMSMDESARREVLSYYEKMLSYVDRYSEIKDPNSRGCIFNAYGNILAPIGYRFPEFRSEITKYYKEGKSLWQNPIVQELDNSNDTIITLIEAMDEDYLYVMIDYIDSLTEEERAIILEIAERLGGKDSEGATNTFSYRANIISRMICKEITEREALDLLYRCLLENVPNNDYTGEYTEEAYIEIVDFHSTSEFFFRVLNYANLPIAEELEYTSVIIPMIRDNSGKIPYDFFTSNMNYISAEWYQYVAHFLQDFEEKNDFLEHTVILRQPSTYIHSLMVSKIAELIAQEMILRCPELFCGLPGYRKKEDVVAWKRGLLEYIAKCGLLHDIGKCTLVDVINQQTRKINMEEFSVIKNHTLGGVSYLLNDPMFDEYYDVIKGHHKFYNGQGGYPEEFDNVSSPVRIVIDLITIADCMDAALDTLGRNYSQGKTFDVLLKEFQAGAGVRYNPDIVDVIAKSEKLQEKLIEMTGPGRIDIYYQAYEIIYRKTTNESKRQ